MVTSYQRSRMPKGVSMIACSPNFIMAHSNYTVRFFFIHKGDYMKYALILIGIIVVTMRYITGEVMFTYNHDTQILRHYSRSGELINCWKQVGYRKLKEVKCQNKSQ